MNQVNTNNIPYSVEETLSLICTNTTTNYIPFSEGNGHISPSLALLTEYTLLCLCLIFDPDGVLAALRGRPLVVVGATRSIQVSLYSYGHANGPLVQQQKEARNQKTIHYDIRHLPNPPRHLRAKGNGLSRRLQKEFLPHRSVEALLAKVHVELLNAINEGCNQLLHLERNEKRVKFDGRSTNADTLAYLGEEVGLEDLDIDLVLSICWEEGLHRSVAFFEELAQRLAMFKHGDGAWHWELYVNVTHRDIRNPKDWEHSPGQHKRLNKAQGKSRQGLNEKRDRYKCLGDDEN